MTHPDTVRVTLPSDTGYLHLAANLARNAARAAGLDARAADQLGLATDEAVSNVIRHAYHGRREQTVELVVTVHDDRIDVRIIHDGDPPNEADLPSGEFDPQAHARAGRKGGLGVILMRRLVDQVQFGITEDQRNCCLLRIFRSPQQVPPETARQG